MLKGIRVERLYVVLKRTFEFGNTTSTSIEAIWLMKTDIIAVLFRSVKIINVCGSIFLEIIPVIQSAVTFTKLKTWLCYKFFLLETSLPYQSNLK